MPIAALTPSGIGSPDGLAYDLKSKVDELVDAANSGAAFQQQADPGAIKPTANLTAVTGHTASDPTTAHTATTAIAATYADLPAARTSVNALRTGVEAALGELDVALAGVRTDLEAALDEVDDRDTTLRAEVEARLDDIETKLDAVIDLLASAGVTA